MPGILPLIIIAVVCLIISIVCIIRTKQAEQRAVTDPITGGMNVISFHKAAEQAIASETRIFTFVVMSVRNIQKIRHTFGGNNANRVLIHLYKVLSKILTAAEPIGHTGNGTYIFLLKNTRESEVRSRLDLIYESANNYNKNKIDPYYLDIFFGIYTPQSRTEDIDTMMEQAFMALSVQDGDSRYHFSEPVDAQQRLRKQELIRQANLSLQQDDFLVYLQPKVRLSDNRIVGAEALTRWRHPKRGLLTPDMFIPQLDEYHVIHRLDMYIFEVICKKLKEWSRRGYKPCPISVNLARTSQESHNYLEKCFKLCQMYGVDPALIEFEISESLANETPKQLHVLVDEIHSYGFRCSLDNFGRNSIPLHLLKTLNIDAIKLDSSLFSVENNSRRTRFIIEAILRLASQMQIQTVAEGISNASQVQYLQQAACDMVQGFQFFRPMTMEEFQRVAYFGGELRYIDTDENDKDTQASNAQKKSSENIIMFSYLLNEDEISFSHDFSPVLEGKLTTSNASALFRRSTLIHENDRGAFFDLMEQARKQEGWVEDTMRFYTGQGRYNWLEVHLHCDMTDEDNPIISGTMINLAGWTNEVDRWKEKATRDVLTGLYNREHFESFTAATLAAGEVSSAAVVFIDIDDFKLVNDTLGHMVGDDVLRWVAKRMLGIFRHTDVVARYGGDEFVVFVNGISRSELERRLQELVEVFRLPYRNDTVQHQVSGSVGAAMFPADGNTYEDLLDRADTALYHAKSRGKNQFVLYHPTMEGTVTKKKK